MDSSSSDLRAEMMSALSASGVIADETVEAAAPIPPTAPEALEGDAAPAEAIADPEANVADLEGDVADDEDTLDADAEPEPEPEPDDLETIRAELEELRRERAEQKQREDAYLLDQQRQQTAAMQQQWREGEQALDGWLNTSLRTLSRNRIEDQRLIDASSAPELLRQQLDQVRASEEAWVWDQYRGQKGVYEQQRIGSYQTALYQAHIRGFAEKQLADFRLPADAMNALMYFADGSPVDPNAYPARAAEMAENRKRETQLKRQLTQAQRSAKARELAGQSVTTGSGSAMSAMPEFKDWRDELAWAANASGIGPQRG